MSDNNDGPMGLDFTTTMPVNSTAWVFVGYSFLWQMGMITFDQAIAGIKEFTARFQMPEPEWRRMSIEEKARYVEQLQKHTKDGSESTTL